MHPVCQVDLPHGHEVGPRVLRLHPGLARHWSQHAELWLVGLLWLLWLLCDQCYCFPPPSGTTAVRWLLRQVKLGTYWLMKAFDIINGNDNNINNDNQNDTSFSQWRKHCINQHIGNLWILVVYWVGAAKAAWPVCLYLLDLTGSFWVHLGALNGFFAFS